MEGVVVSRQKNIVGGAKRINRKAWGKMKDRELDWYVVFTAIGCEMKAQAILKKIGIVAYLPLHTKWRKIRKNSGERRQVIVPALAGFLFCGVAKEQNVKEKIRDIDAIRNVLSVNGISAKLDGGTIQEFIERNKKRFATFKAVSANKNNLKVGDKAQITEGVLKGYVVDVSRVEEKTAFILSTLFENVKNVKIDIDKLKKIEGDNQNNENEQAA